MKKVFETLDLPKERFFIFAALFGNHMLSESDLKDFFSSIQVDTSTKASVIEKIAQFTRNLEVVEPEKVGEVIANSDAESEEDKEKLKVLSERVVKCLRYYLDVNSAKASGGQKGKDKKKGGKKDGAKEKEKKDSPKGNGTNGTTPAPDSASLPSDTQKLEGDVSKVFADGVAETENNGTVNGNGEGNGNGSCSSAEASPPSSSSSKSTSSLDKLLYRINPEIENVAISRHKSGLMSPYICQILKNVSV